MHQFCAFRTLRRLLAPALLACILALQTAGGAAAEPALQAEWTLMFYVSADNNIEEAALVDLAEMEQALPQGVEIVFLIDRSRGFSKIFGDWTGTRLYRMRRAQPFDMRPAASHRQNAPLPQNLASELIADWGEADMASPATLERFIAEVARRFPARRYALVPWNHGGTWPSLLLDEDGGKGRPGKGSMTVQEFAAAAAKGAASLPRGRFDLVLYDMCLMGQLDVMAATAPVADYAFACAPVEPTQSLDYLATLPLFGQGLPAEEILRRMVDVNAAYYRSLPEEASFTACDLSRMPEVEARLRGLASKLSQLAGSRFRELTRAACFAARQGADLMDEITRLEEDGLFAMEIHDWLDLLDAEVPDAPRAEIQALRQALSGLVLRTASVPDQSLSRGLTLYHPLRRAFVRKDYARTDFARASGLDAYFGALFQAQERLGNAAPRIGNIAVGTAYLKPGRDGSGGEADLGVAPVSHITPFTQTAVKFDVTGSGILTTCMLQYEKHGKDYVIRSTQLVTDQSGRGQDRPGGVLSRVSPAYRDGTTTFVREFGGAYKMCNGRDLADASVENIAVSRSILENVSTVWGLYSSPETGGRELLVKLVFSNKLRTLLKAVAFQTDAQGRIAGASQIQLRNSGTLRPALTVFDSSKGFAQRRVFGKPLSLAPGKLFLCVDMLDEGTEVGDFIVATTMNGKSGIGLSPALRVRRDPEQVAMAERARRQANQDLPGRYAMIRYVTTNKGVQVTPSFQTLEIVPDRPLPRFVVRNTGQETGSGLVDWRPQGTPQIALFKRPTKLRVPLGEHVQTWYVFLRNGGADRVWYAIGMGDGLRWAFVPLEQYSPGFLEGVWTAPGERWEFRGGTVRLDFHGQNHEGTFALKDNVITCTGMPAPAFAVYFDREQDTLVLLSSDKHRSVLKREGGAWPAPQPQRIPAAHELAGGWHAADAAVPARLDIVPVAGTPYLNVYYSYQGRTAAACTAALSGNELLATFSDGRQERMRYVYTGRALVISSGRIPVQGFIRD